MAKKILYVSDYTLNQYNSVRDILYNIATQEELSEYEQIIVKSKGRKYNPIKTDYYEGLKTYSSSNQKISDMWQRKDMSLPEKTAQCFHMILKSALYKTRLKRRFDVFESKNYLKSIIKKEKPHLIVFLTYNPNKMYAEICNKLKIPYISILYDTYIGRPDIDKKAAYSTEKFVIDHSVGYYIPDFFYNLYSETYDTSKISSIRLPLLIDEKKVSEAYQNSKKKYDFTYFGNIQSFRNGDKVKELLKELNITLDVFSAEKISSDDVFKTHPAVTKDELYSIVAGSKYLVAMDNGFPYQDYLPSKAYLYVSFTKPIIIFGDNKKSALRDFLDGYPRFFYQNINEPTDNLLGFLGEETVDIFDKACYSRYSDYLPSLALTPLIKNLKKILNKSPK